MKSIFLLFGMIVLLISSAFAQDMQYVSDQMGDTLVVKSDAEFGGSNTLYNLMQSDASAPATRVYMLKNGGVYSLQNNPTTSSANQTIIMGQTQTSLKKSQGSNPPIISGWFDAGNSINTGGGITVNKDLLIKNIDLEIGNSSGNNVGWAFFGFGGAGLRFQVDNCIMEHTWWCWAGSLPADETVIFTNDYFVNLSGHACRRNGGVTDFNANGVTHQDTLIVQNCTHVNNQGTLYKFRYGVNVDKVLFNHNTFINNSGYIFMNNGDQTNMSVTNNIFVNCQLQAYSDTLFTADAGEVDMDKLPMGLINLRVDSTFTANVGTHGFYADKNLAYWDPSLSNIASTLNAGSVNGRTDWVSQMITMNTRTAALFADDATYPLLKNGTWINAMPTFTSTDNLFTTQLTVVKDYSLAAVDVTYGTPLTAWRQAGNDVDSYWIYADWPIPVDLSYSDASLLTAGLGGFPLGDLDWFPTQYAAWKAQEATELAAIAQELTVPSAVSTLEQVPQNFRLEQNYPNPFNPSTDISYTISKAGNVTLKVYNMLGQQVATLVNGFQAANTYKVNFNGSNLSSGIYLYELRAGNSVVTKKMVLMK
jgi:hypothetical protein